MDIITIYLGSILTFECDPKKSVANLQKHGIDFDEAQQLWEGIYIKAPARKRGERRYAVVGVLRPHSNHLGKASDGTREDSL